MKSIEQMSIEELREIVYKTYDVLQQHFNEEPTMNTMNAVKLLQDALDHAQEDHESAKLAILCYGEMTLQMAKEIVLLTREGLCLK